jgi:hypothetical protein
MKSDPSDPKRGIQLLYQWNSLGSPEKTADPVGPIGDPDRAPGAVQLMTDVIDAPAGPGRSRSHGRQAMKSSLEGAIVFSVI